MTKKQDEELLKVLKEIKEALLQLQLQPQVIYVPQPYPQPQPQPYVNPFPFPYISWQGGFGTSGTVTGIKEFQVIS